MYRSPACAILAASLLLASSEALASCTSLPPDAGLDAANRVLAGRFNGSDAVFFGQVTGFDYLPYQGGPEKKAARPGAMETVLVRLAPSRQWKGKPAAEFRLDSGFVRQGQRETVFTSVAYKFELGKTYLVFAHLDRGTLTTNTCAGNRAGEDAAHDMIVLADLQLAGSR